MVERQEFTEEFRRMVAKSYYTSDKSLVTLGKEFKINRGTIYNWVNRYKEEFSKETVNQHEIRTFSSVTNSKPTMKKKELTPLQMSERILELEQKLKHEQMRAIVLDQMIDLAERDLKISIRKKSGAKQSK